MIRLILYLLCLASMAAVAAAAGGLVGWFVYDFLRAPIGIKQTPFTPLEYSAVSMLIAGTLLGAASFGLIFFLGRRETRD